MLKSGGRIKMRKKLSCRTDKWRKKGKRKRNNKRNKINKINRRICQWRKKNRSCKKEKNRT